MSSIVNEMFNIAIITAIIDVINAMSQSLNFFILRSHFLSI